MATVKVVRVGYPYRIYPHSLVSEQLTEIEKIARSYRRRFRITITPREPIKVEEPPKAPPTVKLPEVKGPVRVKRWTRVRFPAGW